MSIAGQEVQVTLTCPSVLTLLQRKEEVGWGRVGGGKDQVFYFLFSSLSCFRATVQPLQSLPIRQKAESR